MRKLGVSRADLLKPEAALTESRIAVSVGPDLSILVPQGHHRDNRTPQLARQLAPVRRGAFAHPSAEPPPTRANSCASGTSSVRSSESGQHKSAVLDRLIERMEREEFDLVAAGRALITDPNWVAKTQGSDRGSFKGFDAASLAELV